jgi:hypothetical protein
MHLEARPPRWGATSGRAGGEDVPLLPPAPAFSSGLPHRARGGTFGPADTDGSGPVRARSRRLPAWKSGPTLGGAARRKETEQNKVPVRL